MKGNLSILDREHKHLLEEIQELSGCDGELGETFREVGKEFSSHLHKEEETVVPLLEYLGNRSEPNQRSLIGNVAVASENFQMEYQSMLEEHQHLGLILETVDKLGTTPNTRALGLVHELQHHIAIEEEILYPAALAAGDLFRLEANEKQIIG